MITISKDQFVRLLIENKVTDIDSGNSGLTYGYYQGWLVFLTQQLNVGLHAPDGDPHRASLLSDFYHAGRPSSGLAFDGQGFVFLGEDDHPYDVILHLKTLMYRQLLSFGEQYLPACGLVRSPAPDGSWELGTWKFRPSQASFGYVLEGSFVFHFLKYARQCDSFGPAEIEEQNGTAIIHSVWGLQYVLSNLFAYVNLNQCK